MMRPRVRRWCVGDAGGTLAARLGAVAVVVAMLSACLPVPDVRVPLDIERPTYRVDPASVRIETTWFDAPSAPQTPPEYDRTGVRRSFLPHDELRVIVVAVPGLLSGAASFDVWARQLVAAQAGLEVWTVDRRSNQFEDRTGIARALEAGDPSLALRYYFGDGREAAEFVPRTAAELDFMKHWGLHVHLRDLHSVVARARATGARVVLAGHSLGAGIASVYAAFRIPSEDGGGVGGDHIDALLLLDGTIGRTGAFGRTDRGFALFGIPIVPTIDDLLSGRSAPFLTLTYGPRHFVRHAVIGVYALLDPEGTASPSLSRFPISNRALLGVISDDEYSLAPAFGVSVGSAVDARFSGNVTAFVLMGAQGARSRTVIGVAPGAERVDWTAGDPLREFTDLASLAAVRSDPDADVNEWYFPLRLLLDLAALDPRLADIPGFVPGVEVDVPTLAIGAARGLVQGSGGFDSYVNTRAGSPIAVTMMPGFTHSDLLLARDNPAVSVATRWLRGVLELPAP
ncbi:MAG: hypothetical protein H0U69_01655 [Trueperaceae bacterium]|nr:hypothetical protein [Trueperaceae bacterium]